MPLLKCLTQKAAKNSMSRFIFYPTSKRSNIFLWTAVIEAIAVCTIETIIFVRVQSQILDSRVTELLTLPVYLAIYIFSQVFLVCVAWDALRQRNTIQAIGLCIFQVSMLVYGALQIEQVNNVITGHPSTSPYLTPYASDGQLIADIRPLMISVPCIIALAFIIYVPVTFALYKDFGYWIYKQKVGADMNLKEMYAYVQVLVCLLKFDFFFFLGFTLQFIVLTLTSQDVEFGLTIAVLPLTLLVLIAGAYSAKYENAIVYFVFLFAQMSGMAYLIFKTFRLWQPSQAYKYINTRRTLTVFAAISIALLIATFVVSIKVMLNFHRGLKERQTGKKEISPEDRKCLDEERCSDSEELDFVKRSPSRPLRKNSTYQHPDEERADDVESGDSACLDRPGKNEYYSSALAYSLEREQEPLSPALQHYRDNTSISKSRAGSGHWSRRSIGQGLV